MHIAQTEAIDTKTCAGVSCFENISAKRFRRRQEVTQRALN